MCVHRRRRAVTAPLWAGRRRGRTPESVCAHSLRRTGTPGADVAEVTKPVGAHPVTTATPDRRTVLGCPRKSTSFNDPSGEAEKEVKISHGCQ